MKCPHCGKAITVKVVKRRTRKTTLNDVLMWGFKKGAETRKAAAQSQGHRG
jgi:hypothetical protein